ncbi:MAG: phosphoadenosine phosphosulfate reductase family protein, partial [Acidobacteriota bacterium]
LFQSETQGVPLVGGFFLSVPPETEALLRAGSPVAIGVSGGKDSCAVAFATVDYLNSIDHSGPRLLIHSDLGRTEWRDSLPTCERLAHALDLEIVVVRRKSGDMLDRWQQRWRNNVARYAHLQCVKLILPWSTPAMRFCTSELKTAIICRYLVNRFPGQFIISASGIRREESPSRAKKPIVEVQAKLTSKTTRGLDWRPIIEWKKSDVFAYLDEKGFELHEAYRVYGSSRVSCCFCILGSQSDLRAAAGCKDNHELYREMVALEIESTFAFQSSGWLGDVAPDLLAAETRELLAMAKERARRREEAESRIPQHMLYVKGWPVAVPTRNEAELLAEVRQSVASAVGLETKYTDPDSIIARYEELMALKEAL